MEALVEYNASQTFQYQPITEPDGIRLLILHPAELKTAEVRCSLVHTTLSQCEYDVIDHYTALSYVWGDASILNSIWVNDRPLKITTNLHDALLHMRDATRELRLWADAICINQTNDEEKNRQVSMMGKIYSMADHTIIFLGVPEDDDWSPDARRNHINPTQVREIILRPWFRRVWTFQELVFSKDPWVQYGQRRWKWNHILSFFTENPNDLPKCNINPHDSSITSSIQTAEQKRTISVLEYNFQSYIKLAVGMHSARQQHIKNNGRGVDMMTLVSSRRGLGVTDPRDMIFAHTGFASDGDSKLLQIDYTKKWEDVYTNFALHQVGEGNTSRLLFYAHEPNDSLLQRILPSWVPDWRVGNSENGQPYLSGQLLEPVHLQTKYREEHLDLICTCLHEPPTLLFHGCYQEEKVVKYSVLISYEKISSQDMTRLSKKFTKMRDHIAVIDRSFYGPPDLDEIAYTEAYLELYNAWRNIMQDDEILPDLIKNPIDIAGTDFRSLSEGGYPNFLGGEGITLQQSPLLPVRDSIADCLVAAFDPGFNKSFLEGRRLARFSNRDLALVPATVQLGDFAMYTQDSLGYWFREPVLLRHCSQERSLPSDVEVRSSFRKFSHLNEESMSDEEEMSDVEEISDEEKMPGEENMASEDNMSDSEYMFPLSRLDVFNAPVKHCTFVGPTFVHGLEFLEATSVKRICEIGKSKKELLATIYAIH
ncbi:hypothetical protein EG329_010847 [Mollisiaceae sp. DMI_Dod_QoI]|nr:hypothetical protein EG329_010847 [Helotiales sp. DMI_Dod_QoI]